MKERTLPRKPVVLSESTQRRLGMYALSASATAVGALALTQPAEARIVYRPLHIFVSPPGCVGFDHKVQSVCWGTLGNWGTFQTLRGSLGYFDPSFDSVVARKYKVLGTYALALRSGARIGPAQPFRSAGARMMAATGSSCYWFGPWTKTIHEGVSNRYFGFKFKGDDSKLHYGWARLTVKINRCISSVLVSGLAYETIPNKPIIAGKTEGQDVVTLPVETRAGTLGHLALGRR